MSAPRQPPTTQTDQLSAADSDHPVAIHLEPRFVPATDSQFLIIDTALRLLSAWAARAAKAAEQAAVST